MTSLPSVAAYRPRSSTTITSKLLVGLMAVAMNSAAVALDSKASLLDVHARQQALQVNRDPRIALAIASLRSCLALPLMPAPQGEMRIPRHYLSGSHGPTNPDEAVATQPYHAFEERVSRGMNRWMATGRHDEASCAQQQIDAWAKAGALLDYDPHQDKQAWFQVEWTLSAVAVSESFLINDPAIDHAMLQRDTAWMANVAHRLVDWDDKSRERNNHHDWRALAAMASGVVSNDASLVDWSAKVYRQAIDQVDAKGAFPLEMQRHELALHYQAFALTPLVTLAMLGEGQGMRLFDYRSPSGKTLHDAVDFLGLALEQPALIGAYTPEPQNGLNSAGPVAFAEYYAYHYGAAAVPPAMQALLGKPAKSNSIGGNVTVLAGDRPAP